MPQQLTQDTFRLFVSTLHFLSRENQGKILRYPNVFGLPDNAHQTSEMQTVKRNPFCDTLKQIGRHKVDEYFLDSKVYLKNTFYFYFFFRRPKIS
jgi:hypothetical protein